MVLRFPDRELLVIRDQYDALDNLKNLFRFQGTILPRTLRCSEFWIAVASHFLLYFMKMKSECSDISRNTTNFSSNCTSSQQTFYRNSIALSDLVILINLVVFFLVFYCSSIYSRFITLYQLVCVAGGRLHGASLFLRDYFDDPVSRWQVMRYMLASHRIFFYLVTRQSADWHGRDENSPLHPGSWDNFTNDELIPLGLLRKEEADALRDSGGNHHKLCLAWAAAALERIVDEHHAHPKTGYQFEDGHRPVRRVSMESWASDGEDDSAPPVPPPVEDEDDEDDGEFSDDFTPRQPNLAPALGAGGAKNSVGDCAPPAGDATPASLAATSASLRRTWCANPAASDRSIPVSAAPRPSSGSMLVVAAAASSPAGARAAATRSSLCAVAGSPLSRGPAALIRSPVAVAGRAAARAGVEREVQALNWVMDRQLILDNTNRCLQGALSALTQAEEAWLLPSPFYYYHLQGATLVLALAGLSWAALFVNGGQGSPASLALFPCIALILVSLREASSAMADPFDEASGAGFNLRGFHDPVYRDCRAVCLGGRPRFHRRIGHRRWCPPAFRRLAEATAAEAAAPAAARGGARGGGVRGGGAVAAVTEAEAVETERRRASAGGMLQAAMCGLCGGRADELFSPRGHEAAGESRGACRACRPKADEAGEGSTEARSPLQLSLTQSLPPPTSSSRAF